ncbi:fibronectin type III domain-containing protein [Campylobacter pinnipediorum]|uniref:fibronectin type III domain-containing protein n=1 Tax=Campylobacter pinnipediorum TaxID=1965231 RepID=UPI00084D5CA1|nr:fibronectin type III domain-containing protein [Campylobacter pinnipediorum]
MKKLKLILSMTLLGVLIAGCASNSVPTQQSASLPNITSLKTITDINEIGFEWLAINDENVIGYQLYRMDQKGGNFKPVAQIPDRFATHYVDKNLSPNTTYTYMLKTYSKTAISNGGDSIEATTKPLIESVPFAVAIAGLPGRVKIIWRPHPSTSVVSYIIKRANFNSDNFREIAEVKGRLNAEFIDSSVKHGNTYKYIIEVKTGNGVISKPSEIIKATTKELPKGVINLTATQNAPKKIILSWDGVAMDDFSHYNVYRSISKFLPYTYLAKTTSNHFEDLINSNDTTRYYKVTVVDKDELESIKQDTPVEGKTLESPLAPEFISYNFNGSSINLNWNNIQRAVSYTLYRKDNNSNEKIINNIKQPYYEDSDIEFNATYTYKVVAIDKFDLVSKHSNSLEVSAK